MKTDLDSDYSQNNKKQSQFPDRIISGKKKKFYRREREDFN